MPMRLAVILESGKEVVAYQPDDFLRLLEAELKAEPDLKIAFDNVAQRLKDQTRYV